MTPFVYSLLRHLEAHFETLSKAQCLFTLCAGPGKEVRVFDGRTEGKIVEARGPKDRLFQLSKLLK